VFPAQVVKADEDQWVPLDPLLWDALNALPRQGTKVFRCEAIDCRGDRRVTDITISARVRDIALAAGVKMTSKSLRRGFGCRYAARVPAQVLQRLMRHASIRTTIDFYANVDDAAMEAVLGTKRNSLRNKPAETGTAGNTADDTTSCHESGLQ
jgi:integrase